jgi:hypothetical protein
VEECGSAGVLPRAFDLCGSTAALAKVERTTATEWKPATVATCKQNSKAHNVAFGTPPAEVGSGMEMSKCEICFPSFDKIRRL